MTSQPTNTALRKGDKLLGLELIRFVCACAVLFWHYKHFAFVPDGSFTLISSKQPFYAAFGLFYDHGIYGVQIFWCISGYIFFWKYGAAIAQRTLSFKRFFILRFSRLYPLHILTLLLVLVLQSLYFRDHDYFFVYQHNGLIQFISQIFLASSWGFTQGDSFNGPIWTISVEVLVYLVFFVLLRQFGQMWIVNVGIVLFCIVATLMSVSNSIIECLAFFYVGGVSALATLALHKTNGERHWRVAAMVVLVFLVPSIAVGLNLYQSRYFTFFVLLIYTGALLSCMSGDYPLHPRIRNILEAAGNMTYSSYLIHFPIQLAIALLYHCARKEIPVYSGLFFILYMMTTLVVSYVIYRYFEKPAQAFIRERWIR